MNLRDLEYVTALSETRHFGRAAEQCHVTQPTLSMQIARVEAELGVRLFERSRRNVLPTAAGTRIVELSRRVLDGVRQIRDVAREMESGLSGPLYLGVIPTVGPYLLPHILPSLRKTHPQIKLYLREDITERLVDRLRHGDLDAAILSLPLETDGLSYETFYTERFVAALPDGHQLTERKRLRLEDMSREHILLLEEGNCMRDQTLKFCEGARPADHNEYRASSVESLRQMVAAGMGCTFLPELSATGSFAAASPIAIRPFENPPPTRDVVLVWRESYPHATALRELAAEWSERLNHDRAQ